MDLHLSNLSNGNVSINVYDCGKIEITGLTSDFNSGLSSPAEAIWQMYKHYRENDVVVRSGSGLCGVYPFDPKNPVCTNYIESDTLHSTTCEELARNMFRFYPHLFDIWSQKRILNLLRYHDLGEEADIPDDGSEEKEDKFQKEIKVFMRRISSLPLEEQKELIRDLIMFEHGDEDWGPMDQVVMQFAKLCDKSDAPLGAFIYETQGRGGSLLYKKHNYDGITNQDQRYAREIGDYSQAGIWTAHLIDTYHSYSNFPLFLQVINAACEDVRGEEFPWIRGFLRVRGFSEQKITTIMNFK